MSLGPGATTSSENSKERLLSTVGEAAHWGTGFVGVALVEVGLVGGDSAE